MNWFQACDWLLIGSIGLLGFAFFMRTLRFVRAYQAARDAQWQAEVKMGLQRVK